MWLRTIALVVSHLPLVIFQPRLIILTFSFELRFICIWMYTWCIVAQRWIGIHVIFSLLQGLETMLEFEYVSGFTFMILQHISGRGVLWSPSMINFVDVNTWLCKGKFQCTGGMYLAGLEFDSHPLKDLSDVPLVTCVVFNSGPCHKTLRAH